jgi:hypothetical protein
MGYIIYASICIHIYHCAESIYSEQHWLMFQSCGTAARTVRWITTLLTTNTLFEDDEEDLCRREGG